MKSQILREMCACVCVCVCVCGGGGGGVIWMWHLYSEIQHTENLAKISAGGGLYCEVPPNSMTTTGTQTVHWKTITPAFMDWSTGV